MGVNFTPTLGSYIKPQPLRYWTQPILPLTFDDSLSYMELLAKISAKLNEVIEVVNEGGGGDNIVFTKTISDEQQNNTTYIDATYQEILDWFIEGKLVIIRDLTYDEDSEGEEETPNHVKLGYITKVWHDSNYRVTIMYVEEDSVEGLASYIVYTCSSTDDKPQYPFYA